MTANTNTRRIPLTLEEYVRLETKKILSPLNILATEKELNRAPNLESELDRNCLAEHWIRSGGLDNFRQNHRISVAT